MSIHIVLDGLLIHVAHSVYRDQFPWLIILNVDGGVHQLVPVADITTINRSLFFTANNGKTQNNKQCKRVFHIEQSVLISL